MPTKQRKLLRSLVIVDARGYAQQPGSILEYYFAQALRRYGRAFLYHPVIGIRGITGSIIPDFVLIDRPTAQPVEIQGDYWHTGAHSAGDTYKLQVERNYYGIAPIEIWEWEAPDQAGMNKMYLARCT